MRSPKKLDALPVDPSARDVEVNYRLMDGVVSLFETHAVEVKLNPADKETLQRSLEEGIHSLLHPRKTSLNARRFNRHHKLLSKT